MKLSRIYSVLFFSVCFLVFFLVRCISKKETEADPRGQSYVGAEKCRQCHRDIYDTYVMSNHFYASSPATKKSIAGSFNPGNNTFNFSSLLKIVMEERDSGLYQVAYQGAKQTEAHRFDVTFGRRHAQTFLSWNKNEPYELPISYYTSIKGWATSPGYSPHDIDFSRFISTDCFECHSSFIKTELNGFSQELDKNSLVYGIDCERCHGPAINHVNYHEAYPDVKKAKYIVSNNSLTRQQKLDRCSVCHSGNDKTKVISRFEFKPGDTLAKFLYPDESKNSSAFDVHGNQYQLLSQSACFLGSKTLDCSSCHNPHSNSSSNLKEFSKKCISCHQNPNHETLNKQQKIINKITDNCIDCHMPQQPSSAITFNLEGNTEKNAYLLRTHKIAIYKQDRGIVKSFISYFNKNKSENDKF